MARREVVRSGGGVRQVVIRGKKRSGEKWRQRGRVQVVVRGEKGSKWWGVVAACGSWWCVARSELVRCCGSVLQVVVGGVKSSGDEWWHRAGDQSVVRSG